MQSIIRALRTMRLLINYSYNADLGKGSLLICGKRHLFFAKGRKAERRYKPSPLPPPSFPLVRGQDLPLGSLRNHDGDGEDNVD